MNNVAQIGRRIELTGNGSQKRREMNMYDGFCFWDNAVKAIAKTALEEIADLVEQDSLEHFAKFDFTSGVVDEHGGCIVFTGEMHPLKDVTLRVSHEEVECIVDCELIIDGDNSFGMESASMRPTPKMLKLFGL